MYFFDYPMFSFVKCLSTSFTHLLLSCCLVKFCIVSQLIFPFPLFISRQNSRVKLLLICYILTGNFSIVCWKWECQLCTVPNISFCFRDTAVHIFLRQTKDNLKKQTRILSFLSESYDFVSLANRMPVDVVNTPCEMYSQREPALCYFHLILFLFSYCHCKLCEPMDCSTPGIPVLHHLLEFAQTHVN